MSFFDNLKNTFTSSTQDLVSNVMKFKNKKFMEGTVAVCAIISFASGGASAEEKQKMIGFIQQSKELNVFSIEEVIAFYNKLAESFQFDHDIGKGEAMRYVANLKDAPESAQLAVQVGIAIGKSDGYFDDKEKAALIEICHALDINTDNLSVNLKALIPFILEVAGALAVFIHPNHIVSLCSWGFIHLPPSCIFTFIGNRKI